MNRIEKFLKSYTVWDPEFNNIRRVFSFRTMRKHPELIPLVLIMSVATAGMFSSIFYHIFCNLDVRFVKGDYPRWEMVDPEKPQKLITVGQKWERISELDELRNIIGPYKPK